ncbi:MAG: alpha/beta hydrolase [Candidatus Eiseniibacteriota bacterium]
MENRSTGNDRSNVTNTVVLIHGLWLTSRSWEHWIPRYEGRGFRVIAPTYPGFEVEVEALRADPSRIEKVGITEIADHYEAIIRKLDKPPIIIGHSFGGTVTQLLLDRGVGSAGVCLNSAVVKGIKVVPLPQIISLFPVLDDPRHRHQAVGLTLKQFHYAFTNTLTEEESKPLYDRYAIPAPGGIVWDGALANFSPNSPAKVDFKKADRAPLLFIAGGEDHVNPPAVNKSNHKHQQESGATTHYVEFADRPHFMVGLEDWQSIADLALAWAVNQSTTAAVRKAAAVS